MWCMSTLPAVRALSMRLRRVQVSWWARCKWLQPGTMLALRCGPLLRLAEVLWRPELPPHGGRAAIGIRFCQTADFCLAMTQLPHEADQATPFAGDVSQAAHALCSALAGGSSGCDEALSGRTLRTQVRAEGRAVGSAAPPQLQQNEWTAVQLSADMFVALPVMRQLQVTVQPPFASELLTGGAVAELAGPEWPHDADAAAFIEAELAQLDDVQRAAVDHALQHAVALIQGPPGTGKTKVGVLVARMLLTEAAASDGACKPMLVLCQTNHALDQFLEGVLDAGVAPECMLRIGGRCKSERIMALTLQSRFKPRHAQDHANPMDRAERKRNWVLRVQLDKLVPQVKGLWRALQVLPWHLPVKFPLDALRQPLEVCVSSGELHCAVDS